MIREKDLGSFYYYIIIIFNLCREGFLLTYVEVSMLIKSVQNHFFERHTICLVTEAKIKWQTRVKIFRTKLAVYEFSILR